MAHKPLRAGAFAFLCAASLSLGGLTVAQAATNPANIDFTKTDGTITVNKFEYEGQPVTPDGTTDNTTVPAGAKPLTTAGFTVYKVKDINNTTDYNAAIEEAKSALPTTPNATWQKVVDNEVTGDDGKVTASNLEVGLYAVYETTTPTGYETIKPYYVFLPTTLTTQDSSENGLKAWNYNVQSFPKDAKDITVSKGIKDANKNVGDTVDYFVKSSIPSLGENGLVTWFEFNDYLETENAEITAANKAAINVQIVDDNGNVYQTLDQTYFDVTVTDTTATALGLAGTADYAGAEAIQHTNVKLNTKGLYYLTYWKQQWPDLKVQLNLPATVKDVASTDGKEVNDAAVRYSNQLAEAGQLPYTPPTPPANPPANPPTPPNDPKTPPTTPGTPPQNPNVPQTPPPGTEKPTNEVYTYWGKVKLTKVDAADQTKVLKGAEFKLYRCSNGITDVTDTSTPITIKGKDTWTTDDNGVVEIDGLHVTDYANSKDDLAGSDQTTQYCLVETKAPEGYELLTEPVAFTMSKNNLLANTQTIGVEQTIKNHTSNVFKLPNTGGAGVALMIAFGGLIAGLGVFAARRNSKKA